MVYFIKSLFIVALFLIFSQAYSQQNENILINKAGDTVYIQAISNLEINAKLEEARTYIKKYNEILKPNPQIKDLDSLIKSANAYLIEHKEKVFKTEEFTIREIDDYKREWLRYDNELGKWQTLLADRISEIDKNLFSLKVTINTWQLTSKKSREDKLPKELIEKLEQVTKSEQEIEAKFKNKQDSLYIKQNVLTDFQISIDEVLDHLAKEKENLQSDYFARDCDYLWQTSDSTVRIKNIQSQMAKSTDQNFRSIRLFLETNADKSYIWLIIAILLLLLFYSVNKEYQKKELDLNDEKVKDAQYFLSHYLASGFLIALISTIFIFSNIPAAVREIVQLVLLIPAIFLIQGISDKKLYPLIYTLVFLFIIDEIQVLLDAKSLLARLLLIFSNIIILWILFQVVRKKTLITSIFSTKWSRFTFRLSNTLIIFTILSILFNILGYVNLSLVISNTTISLLLVSVVLIILLKVMLSLIIGLFNTPYFQLLNIIKNSSETLIKKIYSLLIYFAIYLWIRTMLISLGVKDQFGDWLTGLMDVEWKVGTGSISLGGIIGFTIAVVLTVFITKFIKYILEDEIFPRITLPRGVPGAISMLVRYVIVAFGIFVALIAAGLELSKFSLIAGALGVGIGFGLQSIVFNFIAGLILAFERPIQKGDTIEIGTLFGDVTNIGVRASTVRTYDGSEVMVPNGNLISNDLTNWTLSDRKKRREVKVGVAYGNNPREVMELLAKVAGEHEEVLLNPKPWPLFEGFGESSMNFRVLFWTNLDRGMTIKSEVAMNIYDALIDAGIHIPFPQTDLHIKSFDPTVQKTIFPFKDNKKDAGSNDYLSESDK